MSSKHPAWRTYRLAAVVIAATAVYAFVSQRTLSASMTQALNDHLMTIFPLIAAVASFRVAQRAPSKERLGWFFMGAWGTLSAAGNAAWSYFELVAHIDPYPSVADIGYLGGNLFAVAAIVSFAVAMPRASRARTLLDASIIGGSVFLISWMLVLEPVYHAAEGTFLENSVGLAYPVIDVVMVSLVVFLASRVGAFVRGPLVLIGIGLVGWAIADSLFALQTTLGTYVSGGPVDAGWIGGDALIALAAVQAARTRRSPSIEPTERNVAGVTLPYVVAGVAMLAGVLHYVFGEVEITELAGLILILCGVVLRQFFGVLEQQAVTIEHMRSLDEMKTQILRAVSHELRTPLTVIKGAHEMLGLDEDDYSDQQKVLLDQVGRGADRLEEYLVGLLDLERLARGVIEPVRRPTELVALANRIAEHSPTNSHVVSAPTGEVWANIDAGQVERIVENLVINATRHTPKGSTIHITVNRIGDAVRLTVADNGRGVPDEKKTAIFEPFAQLTENSDSANARGSGIGLALVKNFAELHGGRAWVEDNEGGGARFHVVLADTSPE